MAGSGWSYGDPAVELVLLTLATPKGTYGPDATLGVDMAVLAKATANVASAWRDAVLKALARFVPSRLTDIKVEVDPPRGGRLVYAVTFTDPRSSDKRPTTLPLATSLG